jgi:hypothetical protein
MFTCAQPQACPTQQISFSLCLIGESSGVSSQLSAQRRPVHRFISVSERTTHPTHGLPHPTQGHTPFHLCLREEPHTQLMGFLTPHGHTTFHLRLREEPQPSSWDSTSHKGTTFSPSQRGTTHSSHGHTQLMGTPNSWALSQVDSLILCLGGCLT